MTSKKTRHALVSSIISLVLCCSMLLGTTFAWFTDEVTSKNNIIKSGTLDVEMFYGDTKDTITKDASTGKIFDYKFWEPGYTQTKYIKLVNNGDLAFKYQLKIVPNIDIYNDGTANLADVIDVYCIPAQDIPDRATVDSIMATAPSTTLSELMTDADGAAYGIMLPENGSLDVTLAPEHEHLVAKDAAGNPVHEYDYCIILHMQEEAGNEYQNLTVGEGFSVQLIATQYTWENDSIDNGYDEDTKYKALPDAAVTRSNITAQDMILYDIETGNFDFNNTINLLLDTAYEFEAEDSATAAENYYADWLCDYYVSLNKAPESGLMLAGAYGNFNNGIWVTFEVPTEPINGFEVQANEFYPLLGTVTNGGQSNWTYTDIASGVQLFTCGAVDTHGLNAGTTMTVELRIVNPDPNDTENPQYITLNAIDYTFGAKPYPVSTDAELAAALTSTDESIDVILANDIDLPISSLGAQTPGSGEYKLGGDQTKDITIDLNGKKLNITTTYWSGIGAKNPDATITIKNGTMTSSQPTGTWNSYDLTFSNCNYVIEDVDFEKAVALSNAGKSVTMKNVTIEETHDYYALWITAEGQDVEIDNLTVNSAGRGIKIDEQYVSTPAKVTLKIADSKFTTANKAAILVKSAAGADVVIDNVDISGVTADTVNAVWVDEDAAAYANLVTVTGSTKIVEP